MQSAHLKSLIEGGALLAGSSRSEGASKLEDVLRSRLSQYYAHLGREDTTSSLHNIEDVQVETAREALQLLEDVQLHLSGKSNYDSEQPSTSTGQEELLGTRDLGYMRTLLSLVFKWSIEPWLSRVCASIPTTTPGARRKTGIQIIDLSTVPEDFQHLKDAVLRLIRIILPTGLHGPPNATILSSVILDKHLPDLLKPCLVLGWLPKSLASESVSPINELRPVVVRLMHMLPVSKCITALSAIRADVNTLTYVRKACSYLMSRQLLRNDGVRGLLLALFPDDEVSEENAPLEKLESVSRVLQTIPAGMTAPEYYEVVLPQLLSLLSSSGDIPTIQRRVAAFALSRLLSPDANPHHTEASRIVLPLLQKPFLQAPLEPTLPSDNTTSSNSKPHFSPIEALDILQTFLANTDPSPTLISGIMTPIIPAIYAMSYGVDKIKSADPALKAMLEGLLGTWGRLIGSAEGVATLWLIVDGEGGEWRVDVAGNVKRVESPEDGRSLSLFTPEDLKKAEESGEFDVDANILDLRPDPAHFAAFLKSLDRPDMASEIFVRVLDAYRESESASDADPLRTLLYLQLVVQIQSQLSSGDASMNILQKPDQILSFIKHALEPPQKQKDDTRSVNKPKGGLGLDDLRIVEEDEDEDGMSDDEDSDDEDGGDSPATGGEDMTSTAINLLLSVLEANPKLSTENAPILDEIFSLLDKLARADTTPEALKTLTREALMVLVARLASSSAASSSKAKSANEESPTDTYQKALKLLQDPLLPVRAHGLLLLRQLVSSRQPTKPGGAISEPAVDRALIPGILSIFLQSLQDDDSYIFLNAVQGLAAMVDGFGKEVLKGLVEMYAKGLDGIGAAALTKQDVDTRTRIGEALGQVVRRCGETLPKYIDEIAPPLVAVMRSSHLPTALRTSSLALLAQCTNTSPLAILPWAADLFSAMIDLLQLESVQAHQNTQRKPTEPPPSTPSTTEDGAENSTENTPQKAPKVDFTDFKPTTRDSKIPILRRSALHLLSLLTRAFASQLNDSGASTRVVYALPGDLMRRARTTVGYVAATDEDGITRVMARETGEGLDALAEAMLGL